MGAMARAAVLPRHARPARRAEAGGARLLVPAVERPLGSSGSIRQVNTDIKEGAKG
jgi:hypothetical protein